MTRWQRRARLFVAVFAVVFAVVLVVAFKRGASRPVAPVSTGRVDPNAIVESTSGRVIRFNGTRADVIVEYQKQLTYRDGSIKVLDVKVATNERGGRTFSANGKEGSVGQNDSTIDLTGDVTLQASDGLTARTEHATYTSNDGILRAPGPVQFSRKGINGAGVGMTYDKNADVLVILDRAEIRLAPDSHGVGGGYITSGGVTVARQDKEIRFERGMKALRAGQLIGADNGVAHMSDDQERVERVELFGSASVAATKAEPGTLQWLTGHDMNLKYAPDGNTLERATIIGSAVLQLAGDAGADGRQTEGRQIEANTLDVTLGPDGTTPIALIGRDGVRLKLPPDEAGAARTIKAVSLDGRGDAKKGLTNVVFTGEVDYRERSATISRTGKAGMLEVATKPGMSSIEEARFTRNARFATENGLFAVAAIARYVLAAGTLELSGSEPAALRPRLTNDQIAVDGAKIDATLAGPKMKAAGDIRSVIQPPKKDARGQTTETKMPSMLKPDLPVNVIGNSLDYDGTVSLATYTGGAKLWQADTSVQGDALTLDNKKGDLRASGSVATSSMLRQVDKEKGTSERVRTIGTSNEFAYEESMRRATYTEDAHLNGAQGDMTAAKIELYLRPSGDEVDRAEAYEMLTLREQSRKTTGARMTYTADNDTYVVTGAPVSIIDECGRETVGRKVTFVKATDTVNVDSNGEVRTQTRGGKCS